MAIPRLIDEESLRCYEPINLNGSTECFDGRAWGAESEGVRCRSVEAIFQ